MNSALVVGGNTWLVNAPDMKRRAMSELSFDEFLVLLAPGLSMTREGVIQYYLDTFDMSEEEAADLALDLHWQHEVPLHAFPRPPAFLRIALKAILFFARKSKKK